MKVKGIVAEDAVRAYMDNSILKPSALAEAALHRLREVEGVEVMSYEEDGQWVCSIQDDDAMLGEIVNENEDRTRCIIGAVALWLTSHDKVEMTGEYDIEG